MNKPVLLNDREAAELLRVKPCTVRNERVRKKLSFIRVGRRIFYSPEQIAAYVERQKVEACANANENQDKLAAGQPTRGVAPRGTTPKIDKHIVSALAQRTFKKRA
jgi:hypothetical protein